MFKVLIADDDPFILDGLSKIVKWEQMNLQIAGLVTNGLDAKQFISEHHVDIFLTDICMPSLDGLSVIQWIREMNYPIRCVVLSGYDDAPFLHKAVKLGIDNYLVKPIDEIELEETLSSASDKIELLRAETHFVPSDILRISILERWMQGRIKRSDLLERMELLSLRKNVHLFRIYLFRCPAVSMLSQSEENYVYDCIRKYLDTINTPFIQYFTDSEGDITVIEGCENDTSDIDIDISHIVSELTSITGNTWFGAVGSLENGYDKASSSYKNAKLMMEYSVFSPSEYCFYYDTYKGKTYSQKITGLSELREKIKEKDTEAIECIIDSIFAENHSSEDVPPDYFSSFVFEAWTALVTIAENTGISIGSELKSKRFVYDEVMGLRNISEMKLWLESAIGEYLFQSETSSSFLSPLAMRTIEYLKQNISEEMSLKTLASRFHCSPAHLGRIFKKEIGEPFSEYLNRTRIEYACKLLIETDYSLSDISEKIGYSNINYFFNVFGKLKGCSPKKYRSIHTAD